ncbi:hypothetical protein M0R04_06495 [Candidatus Dojkabacteria bacterium]|jgi:hypothetical protein|nr:hypothetical protein [Candidatus Dojkabacteria bacterium]
MNYELAEQLKDAGFPQRKEWDEGYFYCKCCRKLHLFKNDPDESNFVGNDYLHRWKDYSDNWITCPSLEELITACGDEEFSIGISKYAIGIIVPNRPDIDIGIQTNLIQAVAKLWLELNKKHE